MFHALNDNFMLTAPTSANNNCQETSWGNYWVWDNLSLARISIEVGGKQMDFPFPLCIKGAIIGIWTGVRHPEVNKRGNSLQDEGNRS